VRPVLRPGAALALAATMIAAGAGAAEAHIQVSPTAAAPDDAVEFRVLIPGEREQETTRVDLKVPNGVLPFSFGQTPGWKRRTIDAPNGAVDRIVWTGRLPHDGFVAFSFLASTPPRPGTIAWKALQTYSDGKIVRWIGPPDSDNPAPTTKILAATARQNAGGESEGGADGAGQDIAAPSEDTTAVVADASSNDSSDWFARAIALAALLAALIGIALLLLRRGGRTT
jgi:uncharacterized protein YcnI